MTALSSINLGTPPSASDGDTVRTGFSKVNSNVTVLSTQAALTSGAAITSAQALTVANVGTRVNISLASAGVINMPLVSTCAADNVILLRNMGAYVATLAIANGSSDTCGLSRLNPGETVLMDTDGVHAWNVLMRGRTNSDNEVVNGNCTVNGNETLLGLLTAAGITLSSGSVTFQDGTQQSSAAAGRNRIINGCFRVNVRNYGGAFTSGVSGYGVDRWLSGNSAGGQFNQSINTVKLPSGRSIKMLTNTVVTSPTTLTGSNNWNGAQQRIEGQNCFDMLGQKATLSFWFNTNVAGTYSAQIWDQAGNNTYLATFSAVAGVQFIVLRLGTLPTTLGVPNTTAIGFIVTIGCAGASSLQSSTVNAWQTGNYLQATGSNAWTGAANNFIAVGEVQLETGDVLYPVFERKPISQVLAECQRYGQTVRMDTECYGQSGQNVIATTSLPVTMRATPTSAQITAYSLGGAAGTPSVSGVTAGTVQISSTFSATGIGFFVGGSHMLDAEL